jgi:hypothetical protein
MDTVNSNPPILRIPVGTGIMGTEIGKQIPNRTRRRGCVMKKRSIKSFKELRKTWNFCKGMGITNVIEVPIRKKGMTGSGMPEKCHSNVNLLVRNYGGSSVLGYAVTIRRNGVIKFYHHSVWETPEGKIVDCTYNDVEFETFLFLPLVKFDPKIEEYINPPNVIFHPVKGALLFETGYETRIPITNTSMKRGRKHMRGMFMKYLDEPVHVVDGGFTEPSTATGKYFELRDAA